MKFISASNVAAAIAIANLAVLISAAPVDPSFAKPRDLMVRNYQQSQPGSSRHAVFLRNMAAHFDDQSLKKVNEDCTNDDDDDDDKNDNHDHSSEGSSGNGGDAVSYTHLTLPTKA